MPEASRKIVASILRNKKSILRFLFVPQGIVGLFLILVGFQLGKVPVHLLQNGTRVQGRIIGYRSAYFSGGWAGGGRTQLGNHAFLPIVEFQVQNQTIRFEESKSSNSEGPLGSVPVLYDPTDLSRAMIDRQVMNGMPWAPILAVGLLLFFAAAGGALRFFRKPD